MKKQITIRKRQRGFSLLELMVVLLVLGAILLTRFAEWSRGRYIAYIDARANGDDELVRSEAAKHRQVVAQVVTRTGAALLCPCTGTRRCESARCAGSCVTAV